MMRKILALLLAAALLLSLAGGVHAAETEPQSLSQGVQNIVKRAYQMTEIQWTPQADIVGWGSGLTYRAGTTYKGLPYGQPVYASYVPWYTSLSEFIDAVNDPNSKMYTDYSSYNKRAPYYSIDCSAFVSWAWGLSSRQTTSSLYKYATEISATSYADMQVGDCLNKSTAHVVLVTDITYDAAGNINGVEISESTTNYGNNYCCLRTWYGSGHSRSLSDFYNKYFGNGYVLYRCNTRDSVTYTHDCNVPLEGDVCAQCGVGTEPSFGIDVSHHQGEIDWDTVATQIDFAILRCSYSVKTDDRQWEANADACTRLGIPFGVYIYSLAVTEEEARNEAAHVLELLEGYAPDLPIYLDLEDATISDSCSAAEILNNTRAFCETLEAAGYEVGIYANYYWWTTYLTAADYDNWERWIAKYADSTGYSKPYAMWQYTSEGSVSGIDGDVDLNYRYVPLPETDHDHSYICYVSKDPTCTNTGIMTYKCSACGQQYTESIPAKGHSYKSKTQQPTCTESGSTVYTCSACGSSYTEETDAALGHAWDAGTVTVEPTEETAGLRTYTCTRCGASETEEIPPLEKHLCDGGDGCPSAHFTDVPVPENWAHAGIDYAVENSLFFGTSDTTFSPNSTMTRAMLVTVLWRYAGAPVEGTNTFTDVSEGRWYTDAVVWAAHNDVVAGVGEGKFDPHGAITREQMAAILYRYAQQNGIDIAAGTELDAFADGESVSTWAQTAVEWAVAEGIISGVADGDVTDLKPRGNATRAQVAAILMRFIENVAN